MKKSLKTFSIYLLAISMLFASSGLLARDTKRTEEQAKTKEESKKVVPRKFNRPRSPTTSRYDQYGEHRAAPAPRTEPLYGHPVERRDLNKSLQDENFLMQSAPGYAYPATVAPTTTAPTTSSDTSSTGTTSTSTPTPASTTNPTAGQAVGGNGAQQLLHNLNQQRLQELQKQNAQ